MNRTVKRRPVSGAGTNFEEMAWKASVRRHNAKLRRERRAEWYAYHVGQAERLRRTMTALVENHEAKAQALLEDTNERSTR